MDRTEKIPLLGSDFSRSYPFAEDSVKDGSYLLLSVPPNKNRIFTERLDRFCNYSGTTVAVIATVTVLLLIFGVTFRSNSFAQDGNVLKAASGPVVEGTNILSGNDSFSNSEIVLEIPLGRLRGYTRKSRRGRSFFAFYKVPYAEPPLNELRFKDPRPVRSWTGTRNFTEAGPSCIHKSKDSVIGVEDCLYSNIFVPTFMLDSKETHVQYPVMVYIHGGGFGVGNSSKYGADYFMDEDVILITFEYRLGLFGYLNTGDREASGNMGFKDQVTMLKWTKEYIRHFSGDENRVTIFGNSAGGFSVSFLVLSPMGKGLFHRAISQSGTVLSESYDILDLEPERTVHAVGNAFNCSTTNSKDLLECLGSVDARELALLVTPEIKYALTVEKGFPDGNYSHVFMPEKPYKLLSEGRFNPVPYIMGVVSTEWLGLALGLLSSPDLIDSLNTNFTKYAPSLLAMDLSPEECESIKTFYFGDQLISNLTERNLTNMFSDRTMVHPVKATGDFHSKKAETYFYVISKPAKKSYVEKIIQGFPLVDREQVVSHADEVQFFLPYNGYPTYSVEDTDYFPFSEFLVKLWANFAATGKPEIAGKVTDWRQIYSDGDSSQTGDPFWYELNDVSRPTLDLNKRMQFWDTFSHKTLAYDL